MSNVVRLSNRDWVGILCTTVLVVGGLYGILQNQQAKINELAITQAVTISQLETIARMQERILSRLEKLELQ
jgi:hypothetical protein|tara:strand:- start:386 stop:601 length:216 start_codon:yes stop_codon:yes gene_type:complete